MASNLSNSSIEMAKINSELLRANKELKRVSELKSNFLSIASHELKTPLTSIKGYSEIILENFSDKVDESILRMIDSINRAADRLHKVINNMLDVSRIEQKRLRLNPEPLNLAEIFKECIEELSQFSAKRGINFEYEFEPNLPLFNGDKMRIQQVFTNLSSNALKYSPNSSTVTVIIKMDNDDTFHIIIKDNGIGIDFVEQDKIFDPFYEVGSAYRHSSDGETAKFMGGGTGLGLSIVKGIVERHGGEIWVESEGMNRETYPGSEFHITLPVKSKIRWDDDETKVSKKHNSTNIETSQLDQITDLSSKKLPKTKPVILIIDDDKEAVDIARMVLKDDFEIIVEKSGEGGLYQIFKSLPSIVLLDLYLPGLDGTRICKILRSQEETRKLPIAFFSAGTQTDEMQKCFASGADDFIVKPFVGKELTDKIWRLYFKK